MTRAEVRSAQWTLNHFTKSYLLGVTPLRVDGVRGHATNSRIMSVKFYCGYGEDRDGSYKSAFVRRMRHQHDRDRFKYSSREMLQTAYARRKRQRSNWRQNHQRATASGVGSYDGVRCANWLIPYLQWARSHGWRGRLVSGWRDPHYSQSLCFRMCGAPRCPGKCAGLSSNHVGSVKPRGAVDVSDYGTFGWVIRRCPYSPRIFNALGARDPVHFSSTGN